MKKIFKSAGLFIALITINKVQAQDNQSIIFKGTTDPKYNGEFVHIYNNRMAEEEKHDSAMVVNGTFTFKRTFKQPTICYFYSGFELRTKRGYSPFSILIDRPSVISINADMYHFNNSKVTGSDAQKIYDQFNEQTDLLEQNMMNKLYGTYGKEYVETRRHQDTSTSKYKSFATDYDKMSAENIAPFNKILETTIRENPSSFASVILLSYNISDLDLAKLEELYDAISPKYKKGYFADEIANTIHGMKQSALGNMVSEFKLNDNKGNPLNFSSFKGKYILIDFWGSWCGPCHHAFPRLKELYSKYHDKGFEILGIATESNDSFWVKDIEKEKLPWPQMIDIKGSGSISKTQFAITAWPTTVLIGPDGKIIGRFVGDGGKPEEDRDKQLASIFGN